MNQQQKLFQSSGLWESFKECLGQQIAIVISSGADGACTRRSLLFQFITLPLGVWLCLRAKLGIVRGYKCGYK